PTVVAQAARTAERAGGRFQAEVISEHRHRPGGDGVGPGQHTALRFADGTFGADEGNRTPVSSLGSLCSAIEPHPRTRPILARANGGSGTRTGRLRPVGGPRASAWAPVVAAARPAA